MAYLGRVPGEDSSGEKHRRGPITARATRGSDDGSWKSRGMINTGPASASARPAPEGTTRRVIAIATRRNSAVSTLPQTGGGTEAAAEDGRGDRAWSSRLRVGGAATVAGPAR